MTNIKILKKKIIYRSSHRGSKEMDILLGSFVKKHIDTLSDNDLCDLQKLLLIEDEILYRWYYEKNSNDIIPENSVTKLLKKFKI